ncbi:MAG: hypothetical protein CML51_05905 [Rhodobacteraceae bacterium]|nr:hypothetical protein [Paracoccaceae bacterium]
MGFGDAAEEGCSYQRLEMTNAATGSMTNASRTGPTTEFVSGSMVTDATTASPTIDTGHRKCCPPWVRRFCAESDSRGRCLLVTTVIASLLISTAALYQVVTGMKKSSHPEAHVSVKGFQLVDANRATVAVRLKNVRATCMKVEFANAQLVWTPRAWESGAYPHRNATTLYGDSLNAWILGTSSERLQRWSVEESQTHLYVALEMNVVFDVADLPGNVPVFLHTTVKTRACSNAKYQKKRITVSLGYTG